ncbi:unnamed protein product [Gongylonema pulchrum]|uniref:UCH domain-containing protein n=1 Tax=Gongylonema pulchrum TaxID=637853 RepID=A0A183DKK4_9BILA|nr:unnamed protein product [Gongylonema pulchrum]
MQQDAHEFLNYLLNSISETLAEEKKAEKTYRMNGLMKKGSNGVLSSAAAHDSRTSCQPR